MGTKFDLFERAAACASLSKRAPDPTHQHVLMHLRDLWKSLAKEQMHFSPQALAAEIKSLEEVQSMIGIFARSTVH